MIGGTAHLLRSAWSRAWGSPGWQQGAAACFLQTCRRWCPPSAADAWWRVRGGAKRCCDLWEASYLCDECTGDFEEVFSHSQVERRVPALLLRGVNLSPALDQQAQAALAVPPHGQVQRLQTCRQTCLRRRVATMTDQYRRFPHRGSRACSPGGRGVLPGGTAGGGARSCPLPTRPGGGGCDRLCLEGWGPPPPSAAPPPPSVDG